MELRRQEDFVNAGRTTLDKLNDYIRTCDAVIHLIGDGTGAYPPGIEAEAFLAALPDFASKLGINDLLAAPGLSYTQWEAWLAIYLNKPLGLYRAADVAQRELGFASEPGQVQRQLLHWQRLKDLGRDRKDFVSPHDLSIEVLRALPLMVPGFAENVRNGEFRDRNLLFAVLALQDEILSRENFVRVCTLWGGDTSQSLPDLMQQESMLSHDDRQLVEARIARKLAHKCGDIRQTLAECIGGDVRQSLGDALDPSTFASLPDPLAAISSLKAESGAWRYHLTRTHGVGGLGVVSVAEDAALERSVAVKRLRPERMLDPMAIERFVREARITGRLQHPNIVPVYELGLTPDDQIPFYAMRFIGHRTLHDAITQHYADTKSSASELNLRFRELLQSFLAVCNAVAFAHDNGVIHRDLKPANVMIGDFGEVILLDWGLAKPIGEIDIPASESPVDKTDETVDLGHTLAGARLGSPAYMAPEQAAGRVDLHGPLTDIYGLGAILYEILTGDVPFTGGSTEELLAAIQERPIPDPRVKNNGVSLALSAICRKALAKQPKDRYTSATSLADDVQHWLADEPVSVLSETPIVRLQRKARKNPGLTSAIAASIIVSALGLATGLYFVNGQKNEKELALRREAEQRQEAVKQKTAAEESSRLAARRFDEKRGALDQMLTTFSDDSLKVQPGSQPIRKRFLEEGIEQYSRMLADRANDTEVLRQTASANQELGMVLAELGDTAKGMEALSKAVEFSRKAVEIDGSAPNRITLGNAIYELGQANYTAGKKEDAARFGEESRAIFGELLQSHQDSADCKAGLGRALILCSLNRKLGDGGKPEDKQAIELLRQAVAASPKNAVFVSDLGRAINSAVVLRDGNKAADNQIIEFKEAASLQQRALELQPTLTVAQTRNTRFIRNIAYAFKTLGRPADSLKAIDSAISYARRFSANNPAIPDGQVALAALLSERGGILPLMPSVENFDNKLESIKARTEASRILESLTRNFPNSEYYIIAYLESQDSLVNLVPEAECLEIAARISEMAESAHERIHSSERLVSYILYGHRIRGEHLLEARRFDEAITSFRAGVDAFNSNSARQADSNEVLRSHYLLCIEGLLKAFTAKGHPEQIAETADSLLKTVSLESFKEAYAQRNFVRLNEAVADLLEKAGKNREAIRVRLSMRESAKRFIGGDVMRNWFVYFNLLESHRQIARLAAIVHDDREEFASHLAHLLETVPYVDGVAPLVDMQPNEAFSDEKLFRLREINKLRPHMTLGKANVNLEMDGQTYSEEIIVGGCLNFVNQQLKYYERLGYTTPFKTRELFDNLSTVSVGEKDITFGAMCLVSLSAEGVDGRTLRQFAKLAEIKRTIGSAVTGGAPGALILAEETIKYCEILTRVGDQTRALPWLDELARYIEQLPDDESPFRERVQRVRYKKELISSGVLLYQHKVQEAYQTATELFYRISDERSLFTREVIELLEQLAECSKTLQRPTESAFWILKAAEAGSPSARDQISHAIKEDITLRKLLPEAVTKALKGMALDEKSQTKEQFKVAWRHFSPLADQEEALREVEQRRVTKEREQDRSPIEQRLAKVFNQGSAVLLLYGKNADGKKIYSYLNISLFNLRALKRDIGKGSFNPGDYGEVVAEGYGDPTDEVKAEIAKKYGKTSGAEVPADTK